MNKKNHQYQLSISYLKNKEGEDITAPPLTLAFENHDDIFSIIARLQSKDLFGDKNQAAEFALGLKLFSEVMIRNRNHPLFEELAPAFGTFMKKLKAYPGE